MLMTPLSSLSCCEAHLNTLIKIHDTCINLLEIAITLTNYTGNASDNNLVLFEVIKHIK